MEARQGSVVQAMVGRGSVEGFETITLRAGDLAAAFAPAAGLAGVSFRHRGEELLALRNGLAAYAATGDTMGIPLLHPWANRLDGERYSACGVDVELPAGLPRDEHGLAIHGVPPTEWRVRDVHADGPKATLTAALQFEHVAFPFPHSLLQRVTLEPGGLLIETLLAATGQFAVPVAFGFHPYLTLPGANREDWVIELPRRRHLITDERQLPSGETAQEHSERAALGRRAFDDGYDALGPEPEFRASGGGRLLTVRFCAAYCVAQVFAPIDQDLVCFEPMTAPTNALVTGRQLRCVAPGEHIYGAFEICVRPSP